MTNATDELMKVATLGVAIGVTSHVMNEHHKCKKKMKAKKVNKWL